MSAAQIKVWHKRFKDGRDPLKVIHILGGLQQAEHLRMMNKDQRRDVRELEADLGIPETSVSEILTQDLGTKHVVAKFVLQLLLPGQKERRAAVANDLIQPLPVNQVSSRRL